MWIVNIECGGFSYHSVVDLINILDYGDSYNIMFDACGNLWLEKIYCHVVDNIIEYRTDKMFVVMEYIDS